MNINRVSNQNFGANLAGYYSKLKRAMKPDEIAKFEKVVENAFPGDTLVFLSNPVKNPETLKRSAKVIIGKPHSSEIEFAIPSDDNNILMNLYAHAVKSLASR